MTDVVTTTQPEEARARKQALSVGGIAMAQRVFHGGGMDNTGTIV